jgi:UDP-N-acetylmuramate--alanine ligase
VKKHIFFIGIGGYGLSAIARLMHEKGYIVSGSDRQLSPLALELQKIGIPVYEGHDPAHLAGIDLVVRSSAITNDNVEVVAARNASIPVLKRSEFLGEVMEKHTGIAVAGTHGKTTTTAMISWLLAGLGQDPSYIIGGVSKNLGTNAHAGQGPFFVIEADEYDRMFLGLKPFIAVITNMEHDHPDCYPSEFDYTQAFLTFTEKINPHGVLLVCGDDKGNQTLLSQISHLHPVTYGINSGNNYQAVDIRPNADGAYSFRALYHSPAGSQELASIDLAVPGLHNVRNALASLSAVHKLGLDLGHCAQILQQFSGTGRRFDILGTYHGITLIDDYAHHPTEVAATLEAARAKFPKRNIWVVWQPHTFSRTTTLLSQFAKSFGQADHLIIGEIFASREKNETISGAQVAAGIPHPDIRFIATIAEITEYLLGILTSGDVLIVLSAGDADQINKNLSAEFVRREGAR